MILIIANARIKGGLSGGDNIYLHLADAIDKEWMKQFEVKGPGGFLIP